ncbi:hypothetical protein PGB90_010256 [Kerria lacca]
MTETISVTDDTNPFHEPILSNANFSRKTEEISGDVILQGPDKQKRYVHIKVYRTSLEHFAVVYPLKRHSKPIGIINIRNTCIMPLPYDNSQAGFTINQKMFDITTSVTLYCDPSQLTAWINAFTSRSSPTLIHQTSLPIVKEEDAD